VWKRGGRHRRREPTEQGQGIEVDGDGDVGKGLLEGDADEPVGASRDALLGDGRSENVLAEGLAPERVEGSGARGRVQGEAVEARAEGLVEGERLGDEGRRRTTLSSRLGSRRGRASVDGRRGERFDKRVLDLAVRVPPSLSDTSVSAFSFLLWCARARRRPCSAR
jgi:hypothetical protein